MDNKLQERIEELLESAGYDPNDKKVAKTNIGELIPKLWAAVFNLN